MIQVSRAYVSTHADAVHDYFKYNDPTKLRYSPPIFEYQHTNLAVRIRLETDTFDSKITNFTILNFAYLSCLLSGLETVVRTQQRQEAYPSEHICVSFSHETKDCKYEMHVGAIIINSL